MNSRSKLYLALGVILTVLIIDQSLKFWIKTHLEMGEEINMLGLSWARLHFVENEGMAFGLSLGGSFGKLFLSVFRLVAVGFLGYLLGQLIKTGEKAGVIIAFSLILAGALGNIIDSAFYGLIFSNSPYHGGLAQFMPAEGGYAPFLMGKVVDMLYFPMIESKFPNWVPMWGGQEFEFFRPVFNIADSSIFCGICLFLLFYRSFFNKKEENEKKAQTDIHPEPIS